MKVDTSEQDLALQKRHEERERITHAVDNGEVPQGSLCRLRTETKEIAITSWRFPGHEKHIQLSALRDKVKYFGNGYMVLTLDGARELHAALGALIVSSE